MISMIYILTSVCLAYIFNRSIANLPWIPNTVCFIKWLVDFLQQHMWNKNDSAIRQNVFGFLYVILVMFIVMIVPVILIIIAFFLFHGADWIVHTVVCYQILNLRHIRDTVRWIHTDLLNEDFNAARDELGKFTGHDSSHLNQEEIVNDTVSAIAVKSTEEVISPLFFMCIGGAPLGCLHRAVLIMADRFGSQHLTYRYFGITATRVNSFFNWLPTRVNIICLIYSAYLLRYSLRNAVRIFKRDHKKNGLNAGYPQSVIAGALNIQMGGQRNYGEHIIYLPYIGDAMQKLNCEDIIKANNMMYASSIMYMLLSLAVAWIVFGILL
jgi:adenosylcobinamide-phosphate synthase